MRLIAGTFLAWALTTASAAGGSFVAISAPESPGDSPSIVHLGQDAGTVRPIAFGMSEHSPRPASAAFRMPHPPSQSRSVSPSIIAMGEPALPVSSETVAAIEEETPANRRTFNAAPLVIRGGIVGQPFRGTTTAAPSRPPDAAPEETVSAAPEPPRDAQPQPRPEPSPRRAQQPPAAPTRMPE